MGSRGFAPTRTRSTMTRASLRRSPRSSARTSCRSRSGGRSSCSPRHSGSTCVAREVKVAAVPKYLPEPPEDVSPALAYALAERGRVRRQARAGDPARPRRPRLLRRQGCPRARRWTSCSRWPRSGHRIPASRSTSARRWTSSTVCSTTPCALGKLSDRIPKHSAKWRGRWESLTVALDEVDKGQLGWDEGSRQRAVPRWRSLR